MKLKSSLPILVLFLSVLACGFPSSTPAEPTVNALPPTPDLPFLASPIPQPQDTSTSTKSIFNVNLPASACWMDSNITVSAGQVVSITAKGTINTWNGNQISFNDPNGQTENICLDANCPLLNAGYGTLIGRLEDLQPFRVGSEAEFTAQKNGRLFFTVNDWECTDNSGEFDLVVTIK